MWRRVETSKEIVIVNAKAPENPRFHAALHTSDEAPMTQNALAPTLPSMEDATPAMQQYIALKKEYPDCLLLFQMGDFYEIFFDDALKASSALDIALTKRGKNAGVDIPMCGVPHHAADAYIEKLMRQGFKVALCDQQEDPKEAKKRGGSKAVVKREIVRILTPGTLTEESMVEARQSLYLCALAREGKNVSLAWVDITTGEFITSLTSPENLAADLARLAPKEILLSDALMREANVWEVLKEYRQGLTPQAASLFAPAKAARVSEQFFGVAGTEALKALTPAEQGASAAILDYLLLTQKDKLPKLNLPRRFERERYLVMDASTRRNLELSFSLSGQTAGSLLSVIDRTLTAPGARRFRQYVQAPLMEAAAINARLDQVDYFVEKDALRKALREQLRGLPDMERALARIEMGRGNPKDMLSIRVALAQALKMLGIYEQTGREGPLAITQCFEKLGSHEPLLNLLNAAMADQAPYHAREGNFIRAGFNATLDQYREARDHADEAKIKLRDQYRAETGVATLKIGDNNLIGLYIEVSAQHLTKMGDPFVHRQTMAGAVRYTTPELKALEQRVVQAKEFALSLELQLFNELVMEVAKQAADLKIVAQALSTLDVATALAELAAEKNYTRPHIDESNAFDIKGGRHPVVEHYSKDAFVPNDCDLHEAQRLWLITGPNMGGKSTFLRQNAVIAIMAQMGSFVPAAKAHIGIVDRLFSRVGAADDLARGRSTFMVEMVETATILHQATPRSLVILDEIGRGTATYDGLSLAWAVLEHLHHNSKCRGLFATHYHELTALDSTLTALSCHTMRVKEWQGDVVFLYEVIAGNADRSYGVHVAKLAGIPEPVLKRATEVLHQLENSEGAKRKQKLAGELPLFTATPQPAPAKPSEAEALLASINPDDLSPRDALDLLFKLKALLP